jgi:cytochrome c peroxidase
VINKLLLFSLKFRKIGYLQGNAMVFLLGGIALGGVFCLKHESEWDEIREEIRNMLENSTYDDGSYGPLFVRLAWHASGTYDENTGVGGSNGATMRFPPESTDGANAGLDIARNLLEKVKQVCSFLCSMFPPLNPFHHSLTPLSPTLT